VKRNGKKSGISWNLK